VIRHGLWLAMLALVLGGCFYRAGNNLAEGLLDEALGDTRDQGAVEAVAADALEKQLMRKLGHQLGQGLASGATEISDEERAELEETIDTLLAVAAYRSGKGLREEVGPEFRRIVRRDIVETFADGVRGDLGDSLEETADRVVVSTVDALHRELQDPAIRYTLSEILRDAVYDAVHGGSPASPGIGETLESTLNNNLLDPFSTSVGGVADRVAYQVRSSADRTENLLKTIIGGLVVVLLGLGVLYIVRDYQARRARQGQEQARQGLRSVDAAIAQLDDESRQHLQSRLEPLRVLFDEEEEPPPMQALRRGRGRRRREPTAPPTERALDRSDEYMRSDRPASREARDTPTSSEARRSDAYTRPHGQGEDQD